jgi:hypothetical protein
MRFDHRRCRSETRGDHKVADMFKGSPQGGMRRSLLKGAARLPDSGALTVSKECHDQ